MGDRKMSRVNVHSGSKLYARARAHSCRELSRVVHDLVDQTYMESRMFDAAVDLARTPAYFHGCLHVGILRRAEQALAVGCTNRPALSCRAKMRMEA